MAIVLSLKMVGRSPCSPVINAVYYLSGLEGRSGLALVLVSTYMVETRLKLTWLVCEVCWKQTLIALVSTPMEPFTHELMQQERIRCLKLA